MAKLKRAVILFVFLTAVVLVAVSIRFITRVKPVMADLNTLPIIVIDPGHGGMDGGAVDRSGEILEKDINLKISLMLRDFFVLNGFDVIMTRTTDMSIHDEGITSVRKQKTSDLNNRLKIASADPNTIFISIHQNKFTDRRSKGTQIFYSPNNPASEQYAKILQDHFASMLQPENQRKTKKAGKNLFLMHQAKCPAVLVECGFLSNSAEAELLTDDEYQSKIAFVIFTSTINLLELSETALK
ncbi:MAG: N-acetylmuramoyl-L-alanine amidase [Oscillospiraceae bacterium]|nr:N-acetylmuramoyl-L-alanine amidase [Oscillospiraceae bacterium]